MKETVSIDTELHHVILKWFTQNSGILDANSRVFDRVYTLNDTLMESSELARWRDMGVLSDEFACQERFSLRDTLWLRLLFTAESYSVDLLAITHLFERVHVDVDTLNTLMRQVDIGSVLGVAIPEDMKHLFDTPDQLRKLVEQHPESACILDALLHFMVSQRVSIALIIDQHANVLPYTPMLFSEPAIDSRALARVLGSSHVSICLNDLICDLVSFDTQNEFGLACLDTREQQIFRMLKSPDLGLTQLAVRFDAKNTPTRMDVTRKMKLDTRARMNEVITRNGYEDISVKTENGHVVHVENTQKIKLK